MLYKHTHTHSLHIPQFLHCKVGYTLSLGLLPLPFWNDIRLFRAEKFPIPQDESWLVKANWWILYFLKMDTAIFSACHAFPEIFYSINRWSLFLFLKKLVRLLWLSWRTEDGVSTVWLLRLCHKKQYDFYLLFSCAFESLSSQVENPEDHEEKLHRNRERCLRSPVASGSADYLLNPGTRYVDE